MLNKIFKIGTIIIAFGVIFIVAIIIVLVLRNNPTVNITFDNNSTKDIKSIRLVHEDIQDGILLIEELVVGHSKQLNFAPSGETSYEIIVEFKNGNTIKGERYAEGGYKITEIITDNKIEPNFNFSGAY